MLTDASDAAEDAVEDAEDAAGSATSAAEDAAEDVAQNVDCSGTSCTVTLSPGGEEVEVLGTRMAFEGVDGDEATVTIDGESATCAEGDSVEAGPLTLECTTVSEEELALTASLG